jgi:hypothetical protein
MSLLLADLVARRCAALSLPVLPLSRIGSAGPTQTIGIRGWAWPSADTLHDSQTVSRFVARHPSAAIDIAAARNSMTASEYVRRSVIDRLRADGTDPIQVAATSVKRANL